MAVFDPMTRAMRQEPSACPSFEAGTTTLFEHILERASLTEEEAADYLRQASWELRC